MNFDEIREQWEELESWKKALIVVFFSGIFVYISYMFYLEDKINQKNNLENEVKKLKDDIAYLKRISKPENIKILNKKIDLLRKEIDIKKEELKKYRKFIPSTAGKEEILVSSYRKLNLAGLSLDKFKIRKNKVIYAVYDKNINRVIFLDKLKKGQEGVKLNKISFNVTSVGNLRELINFLKYVKNSDRLILFEKLNIDKKSQILVLDMEFSSYYMEGE